MSVQFWFNADFDLKMASSGAHPDGARSFVDLLGVHYLPALNQEDTLLSSVQWPEHFLHSMAQHGLGMAKTSGDVSVSSRKTFDVFGWNADAEAKSACLNTSQVPSHPDVETIKKVNSKLYSRVVEKQLFKDGTRSQSIANIQDIQTYLQQHPTSAYLFKGPFGNAGMFNRRIASGEPLPDTWLQRIFDMGLPVIVEPWHKRVMDFGVRFNLHPKGILQRLQFHKLINTSDGAFLGIQLSPHRWIPDKYMMYVHKTVEALQQQLHHEGYFGPVGIDGYIWQDEAGQTHIRPLVEINARHTMADVAYGLQSRLKSEHLLWRFYPRRRLDLPDSWSALETKLSEVNNTLAKGKILFTSPLEVMYRGERVRLKKLSVVFTDSCEDGLETVQNVFEKAFMKQSRK